MPLKTLFTIGAERKDSDTLLLEIGKEYCSYAFLKMDGRRFEQIRYFGFDEWEMEQSIESILDELKDQQVQRVIVSSALTSALLVPHQYFHGNFTLLDVVYDLPRQQYFHDRVGEWQIVTIYSIPTRINELIHSRLTGIEYCHVYTSTLKIYNGFVAMDQIDLHFSTQHFRVVVKKENEVQLAQIYTYKTPLDVIYYLLKICYEYHLHQSDVFLVISGLVDKDSALYGELHNYFLNLHFAQAPDYILPETEHPHHYFTSLYNLAGCVS